MRKNLLGALFLIGAMFVFSKVSNAQGTLMHYWNFNSYATTYSYPHAFPLGPIDADFSIHDTSKARIYFVTIAGTSATWHSGQATIMDPVATVPADVDTVNLRQGAIGGTGIRPRNPLDSAYLLFYIPTNNYQNIRFSYGSESSSVASGDTHQVFDYSVDSGVTWITTGLSMLQDSAWLVFHKTSVTFANPQVNNNPKLVFRIHFTGNTALTSGNNRFDNVTVDGDSLISPVSIHYWHFNNYTTTYTYPHAFPLGPIDADISALDTSKARIYFTTYPGASATWHSAVATLMDPVATVPADVDTVNLRFGQTGGTGIRPRNPLDSAYLMFYIPSTGYHDVIFSYGSESSSVASGDTHQIFDYSVDSGLTWRNALLSMAQDSAWLVFHRTTVTFTSDSQANNNPKLVFRIHFSGNTALTSGNNRFDNVTLDGIPYIANNSIATTAAAFGPFCNATANTVSAAYTSVGTYTGAWSVQLSNAAGSFASGTTIIGTGTTSPISASIPSGTAAGTYRVRVINSSPATNSANDNGSNIIVNGPPTAFTVTGSAAYCAGGAGVPVGLSNSQTGVRYKLFLGGTYINDSVNGSNAVISFGPQVAAGTYTVTAFNVATPACTSNMTGSAIVTVNPLPSVIAGNNTICAGGTETLSDTLTGGSWSSGFPAAATIDPASGMLTASSPGLSVITYTLPTGCTATTNVIVNLAVPAIGGTANVCTGSVTSLTDGTGGGTWATSNTTFATVDPFAGTVTGVAAGSSVISYTTPIGCVVTAVVTVNQTPPAISGLTNVCAGSAINLSDAITGGTWSSSDATTASVDPTGIVTGIAQGTPNITYTLPAGCTAFTGIAVNPLPAAITGTQVVCAGSVTALSNTGTGSWSSGNTAQATVDASGNVSGISAGSPVITFALPTGCLAMATVTVNPAPSDITGAANVCLGLTTTLGEVTTGGTWSSDNVSATIDPTGIVTGVTAGTSAITYTLSTGCITTATIVVNPLPSIITGNTNACVGQTTPLTDSISGGSWSSSTAHASVGAAGGGLTGITPGASVITYTLPTGCIATTAVTVNALSPVTGLTAICSGLTATLADATGGGTWSSSNTAAVTIDPATGIFNSAGPGTSTITYTLPTGCAATSSIAVTLSPDAIAGTAGVCIGAATTLTDVGSGTWSSSNRAVATVDAATGTVAGLTPGTTTITYLIGSGCSAVTTVTVNSSPAIIAGAGVVCQDASTTLTDISGGGSWSSSAGTGAVTVDAVGGTVTGVTPGNAVITYTLPTGCTAVKNIIINPLPAAITGIAHLCTTATTTLGDATGGGSWSSSNTSLATVDAVSGIVSGVRSGAPVITYTLSTGCIATVIATINPLPAVFTVTGGGSYCAGAGGLHIGLSGSATGVNYQLFYGITHVGSPIAGTGAALDFGAQTLAETYTVIANDGTTACTNNMAGSAPVVMNALPAVYAVTGGGHFCATGTGVHIGLAGSNTGISYQLFNGGIATGITAPGTSGAVDFGLVAAAGVYSAMASNPTTGCTSNMTDSATVTIDAAVVPSVSIASATGDILCAGRLLTITATALNGGATPVYSWSVNGAPASVSGGSYSYLPADGDIVTVTLASSAACATAATVSSAPLTLSVLANGMPAIHVTASPGDTVCQGTAVNYTSTSAFGGAAPSYSWVVNSAIMGSGVAFSYTPANHDVVSCILSSNYQCRTADSGISNIITMQADANTAPGVTITSDGGATIAHGQAVTLTATVTNGGPGPSYQWYINGAPVSGANGPTFFAVDFSNGDSVTCRVISSGLCFGNTGYGGITIHASSEGVAQITATGSDIRLLPNPNKGVFTVKGSTGSMDNEEVTIVVTDMLGQVVYTGKATAANGKIDQQILLSSSLANGMYLLNVHTAIQNDVFHFVIEK